MGDRSRWYSWARRILLLFVGLILFGVGIAVMVRSRMGLGPWSALHEGISFHTGLEIGTVGIIVGLAVLLAWIPLGQRPGPGTVFNVVGIGIATNMALARLQTPEPVVMRLLWMVAGVLLIGVGTGMYLSGRLGAGPRDGLMMGLHEKTGGSIRSIRTLIELSVLLGGWLLGGTIGVGTIAFAFGIGPIVQPILRWLGGLPRTPPIALEGAASATSEAPG